jgi:hypothetical protein
MRETELWRAFIGNFLGHRQAQRSVSVRKSTLISQIGQSIANRSPTPGRNLRPSPPGGERASPPGLAFRTVPFVTSF